MPAVPKASGEVGMRVEEVMSVSKADCDELCQFIRAHYAGRHCITFTEAPRNRRISHKRRLSKRKPLQMEGFQSFVKFTVVGVASVAGSAVLRLAEYDDAVGGRGQTRP
jgi:hypothetical protein